MAGLAIFLALLWLLAGDRSNRAPDAPAPLAAPTAAPVAPPAQPLADPVLSRARAAFAAGRYEAPSGRNALDLYAAVLLARPGQAEARDGLDRTVAQIVSLARLAEADGNHAEARRLLARVQSADASNLAVKRLAAYLVPPPPPASAAAGLQSMPVDRPRIASPVVQPLLAAGAVANRPSATTPHASLAPTVAPGARPAATYAPPVVRPDPLAPRVVNADQLRAASLRANRGPRPARSFGDPISSGLPIAGYVKTPPSVPPDQDTSASRISAAAAAALAMPADELGRVYSVDPVYPPAALRDHVEGWVELIFTVTETGAVRDIEVVDSEPRGVFESAASKALSAWRFRPRLANGQPVAHRSTVTLRFDVDS
jgi:TonB family protein